MAPRIQHHSAAPHLSAPAARPQVTPARQRFDFHSDRFQLPTKALFGPTATPAASTVADAIAQSENILTGGPINRPEGKGARTVVVDPPNSYDPANTDPGSPRYQQATTQLQTNAPYAQAAAAKISATDQQRYNSVMTSLAGHPVAQLALQTMLLEGKLPGPTTLKPVQIGQTYDLPGAVAQPGNLLQVLAETANRGIPPSVGNTSDFVAQLTMECAEPDSINQGSKGTCGPTSMIIALARSNPSEYARLVAELATNGRTTFANGTQLDVYPGARSDDGSGRSIPQRLLGTTLMQAGLTGVAYDNKDDKNWFIAAFPGGMYAGGLAAVGEMLFGRHFEAYSFASAGLSGGYAAGDIEKKIANGASPVIAAIDFPLDDGTTGGHFVLVTGVKDGYVYYSNPWGQQERMSLDQFAKYAKGVVDSAP